MAQIGGSRVENGQTRAEILADLLHDKLDRHARDAQRYQDALVNLPFDGLPPRREPLDDRPPLDAPPQVGVPEGKDDDGPAAVAAFGEEKAT